MFEGGRGNHTSVCVCAFLMDKQVVNTQLRAEQNLIAI